MKVLVFGTDSIDEDTQTNGYHKHASNRAVAFSLCDNVDVTVSDFAKQLPSGSFDVGIFVISPFSVAHHYAVVRSIMSRCRYSVIEVLWETTSLPESWIPILKMFDGIIVASRFCADLVLKAGIDKPVFYVPFIARRVSTRDISERMKDTTFKVLYVGQNTTRKGLHDAIRAFVIALGSFDDCSLTIRTDIGNPNLGARNAESLIYEATRANATRQVAPIYLIDREIDHSSMFELYEDSSLLLVPSRGEGIGIPYIEALLHGIPSVYVPFSASVETAGFRCNFPVEYVLDLAYDMTPHGYVLPQEYAVPLMRSLVSRLREAYAIWKTQRFSYFDRCASDRKELLRRYSEKNAVLAAEKLLATITGGAPCQTGVLTSSTLKESLTP